MQQGAMSMTRRVSTRRIAAMALLTLGLVGGGCLAQQASNGEANVAIDELLLFFPAKYPEGNWSPKDLQFEDVWFEASDGTKSHGWWCLAEKPRAVVLIAHGNGGHVAWRADWLRYLQTELNVSAFMFDYRGYGRSDGRPSVEGILEDARAARSKLRDLAGVEDDQIVLMGESLGGAVVIQLAAESSPRALVLQSAFSSLRDVADFHYPAPVLISHGTADTIVPFSSGKKLFNAANEPKTLVEVADADHNNALTPEYLDKLDQFVSDLE
jgi:uncharacterized protein